MEPQTYITLHFSAGVDIEQLVYSLRCCITVYEDILAQSSLSPSAAETSRCILTLMQVLHESLMDSYAASLRSLDHN